MRIRMDKEFYQSIIECYTPKYIDKIEQRILDNNYSGIKDLLEKGIEDKFIINNPKVQQKRKEIKDYFMSKYYSKSK